MPEERLRRQLEFALELDKLKTVYRQSLLLHEDRRENTAEHSWHVAMLALVLVEHADDDVDTFVVMKMLMLHDVVEIDAGDVDLYDTEARKTKEAEEHAAAERIFGLLPEPQATELRSTWHDYEQGQTPEAPFARALDRLMPMLHNYHGGGRRWIQRSLTRRQVYEANQSISRGSERLWRLAQQMIDDATKRGWLQD